MKSSSEETSWETSSEWYKKAVGEKGHYYHQALIIPNLLKMLRLEKASSILDLACGQGVLERAVPKECSYYGVDISPSLIKEADKKKMSREHTFHCQDASKPLPVKGREFTHAAIILALQNILDPGSVIKNASKHLSEKGSFILVLNHPCFRIPRQSSWGVDLQNKKQYRRIDSYMSELSIPITTNPGKSNSPNTLSFHRPLSHYISLLSKNGFLVKEIEEWCSDKKSEGRSAKMEDRARKEIPLFMAIHAIKAS